MQASSSQAWNDRHWTSRDGLQLYYRDYAGPADRPPLLCLHGLTRNSADFGDFAARLAGDWRVIAPDFRGRGRSAQDPQPARYTPPVYAGDVLQLLDELALPQAIFIGTSLGGLVTMGIAAVQPQRIAGTLLNDVGPELGQEGIDRILTYVGKPLRFDDWNAAAHAFALAQSSVFPDYDHDDWLRFARRTCREDGDAIVLDYDMRIADNFHAAQGKEGADGWPYFRALTGAPLLVLRGETSDLLSAELAERMVAAHPDAELVTVPQVGHAPDLGEPESVAGVDRLLNRVLGRQAHQP